MPHIRIVVDGQPVDISEEEDQPVKLSYSLEDRQDFQQKDSSTAFNVQLPATLNNSKINNDYSNPSVEDLTAGAVFRNPRRCVMEAGSDGETVFVGKALLKSASHTNRPENYSIDCYGNNGDWLLDLKDATIYDFVKQISYLYFESTIINSWGFDGTNPGMPYVFAPVRYNRAMEDGTGISTQVPPPVIKDLSITLEYMRPSLSVYWILFWGFKSVGYRIQSTFMDTPYFRRLVMPWTWGNYLKSQGTDRESLLFEAKSTDTYVDSNRDYNGFIDMHVSNDSSDGMFDNGSVNGSPGNYIYSAAAKEGTFTYPAGSVSGNVNAVFHMEISYDAKVSGNPILANDFVGLTLYWYRTRGGVKSNVKTEKVFGLGVGNVGTKRDAGFFDTDFSIDLVPGDLISFKVFMQMNDTRLGSVEVKASVESFKLLYTELIQGSTISFSVFTAFKSYKFLDLARGVIDLFDLSINTDPINKVVCIEPTHAYSLTNNPAPSNTGYFNGDWIDWEQKQELSSPSVLDLYSDGEREQLFKYKDDSSDGLLSIVQNRYNITLAQGKYALPERFQTGQNERENRFFSPLMHYEVTQWKDFTGTASQLPIISDNQEPGDDEPTFQPKIAFYKGQDTTQGWVFQGNVRSDMPFMFAVNYRPGGENDPILSYSDEKIGNETAGYALGKGLLRRFFWQRMAIVRNGQFYDPTYIMLNGNDISNVFHREFKALRGQRWELIQIKDYNPIKQQPTECYMRKWVPISQEEQNNTFPSQTAVMTGAVSANQLDLKYNALKCLASDIK